MLKTLGIFMLIGCIMSIGCAPAAPKDDSQPQQYTDNVSVQDEEDSGGIKFGPKMEFGPSYNFSTGQVEFGPSFHYGPRIDF